MPDIKLLIITLHAGEQEFAQCEDSIRQQDYPHITHKIIRDMNNVDAHANLYRMIMDASDDYDLFLKLDADMVLNRQTAISEMIAFWQSHDKPDHMTFAVRDFFSDGPITGVHLFSSHCRWKNNIEDDLFPDPNPVLPNKRLIVRHDIASFVDHAPNPTLFSSFHFGVHRALKAFQKGRIFARPQGYEAFRILMRTAKHYKRTKDDRLRTALLGAEFVRTKRIQLSTGDKADDTVSLLCDVVSQMDDDHKNMLIAFWMVPTFAWSYWWITTGWRVVSGKIFR